MNPRIPQDLVPAFGLVEEVLWEKGFLSSVRLHLDGKESQTVLFPPHFRKRPKEGEAFTGWLSPGKGGGWVVERGWVWTPSPSKAAFPTPKKHLLFREIGLDPKDKAQIYEEAFSQLLADWQKSSQFVLPKEPLPKEAERKLKDLWAKPYGLLVLWGLPTAWAEKAYEAFGPGALALLQEHPYILLEIHPSFDEVDALLLAMGLDEDSSLRYRAFVGHRLDRERLRYGRTTIG